MAIKAGQLKERADYQAYILEMLRKENGYQVRPSTAYDPGYGMDVELLFSFLQATQPDALARLEKLYGDRTRQTILNYINNEVNKKSRSLLDVLKHGVEFDNGVSLTLMYRKPATTFNQKAEALGCTGTHFTNACGLFDENHYTTAKDMARIAAAAMQREDFRRIASAPRWQSAESERNFYNKNKTVHQYAGGDGVKIGFTKASGRTLVASATRNEVPLIAVVLQDGNWFADAYAMLDYGFAVSEGDGR